jgi:hypothetical protein
MDQQFWLVGHTCRRWHRCNSGGFWNACSLRLLVRRSLGMGEDVMLHVSMLRCLQLKKGSTTTSHSLPFPCRDSRLPVSTTYEKNSFSVILPEWIALTWRGGQKWKPRIHSAPLTREQSRAVALGRVLVLTWPNSNDLFTISFSVLADAIKVCCSAIPSQFVCCQNIDQRCEGSSSSQNALAKDIQALKLTLSEIDWHLRHQN